MIVCQVASRLWNQGGQPGDEVLRAEQDVGGAVPEGLLEPVVDLAADVDGQALKADGRMRDAATQSLKAITHVGLSGDGKLQRSTKVLGGWGVIQPVKQTPWCRLLLCTFYATAPIRLRPTPSFELQSPVVELGNCF